MLALLAMTACDEPSRVVAPQPVDPPLQAPAKEGDLDFAVTTWPQQVLAEFETTLETAPLSRDRIVNVEWRFADGTLARGSKIRHTFDREGVTAVLIRATTEAGTLVQKQVTIKVTKSISALAQTLVGIVPGGVHTCAVDVASTLQCWGYNGDGNLGNGSSVNSPLPVAVLGGVQFAQVATGFSHSCALTTAGTAYCWGRNYDGQLGDGTTTGRSMPTPVSTNLMFASIDVGFSHSCAVTDAGVAYCWGSNSLGQLGTAAVSQSSTPVAVSGSHTFNYVRAGYNHSCGLDLAGAAWCWGANNRGQIGNNAGGVTDTDNVTVPTAVAGGNVFTDIDIGGTHNCGIVGGRVYCWGWNGMGQVGANGGTTCVGQPCFKTPARIQGGRRYSAVTAGTAHSCGIDTSGAAYCWGFNGSGQLGDGTTINRADDTKQAGAIQFKMLRAGGSFTCGVSIANVGYCWGSNNTGKLGLGDTVNRLSPTQLTAILF